MYYDFQTDLIEEATPRDLFAREDVHSQEIDLRFRDLIEAPLGRLWKRVRKEGVKTITDWTEIRAAHLVFFGQTARFVDHSQDTPTTEDRRLEGLLSLPEAQLDVLMKMEMAENELRLFHLPHGACLFYPQTGIVGFPVMEDPQKKPLASVTGGFGFHCILRSC